MVFQVIVRAFGDACLREVWVPAGVYSEDGGKTIPVRTLLDLIFQYGQNEFSMRDCPSVSVGDLILLKDDVYEVQNFGFKQLEKV
jgi:hypothetical protein